MEDGKRELNFAELEVKKAGRFSNINLQEAAVRNGNLWERLGTEWAFSECQNKQVQNWVAVQKGDMEREFLVE